MHVDILASIELTVSAAVVVAILAAGLGATGRQRLGIVAAFGLWFALVTALASARLFHTPAPGGVAGLGLAIVVPMLTMLGAAIGSNRVRQSLLRIPVSSLVVANTVRVLGVSFLVLHAQGRLPAAFALTAGWGDIAIGLTAPLVAWLVVARGRDARRPLAIWNTLGLLDLIVAVALGIASSPAVQGDPTARDSGVMTTLPWMLIPAFLVPTLAASHLAIFYRLRTTAAHGGAPQARTNARPTPARL
jgi:hypothetical protein